MKKACITFNNAAQPFIIFII